MTYPVNEIFATIQGEGTWTGTPSVFIRLQGCDVGCPWCDTKHTWKLDDEANVAELPRGDGGPGGRTTWAGMTAEEIAQRAREEGPRIGHAVITGGEPFSYELAALCAALVDHGFERIQVETSGTYPVGNFPTGNRATWLTVSPKLDMPGGRAMVRDTVLHADEIKWPVGKRDDLERLARFLAETDVGDDRPVWLQPLSASAKATELCIAACLEHGYRLSLQTHKLAGIP